MYKLEFTLKQHTPIIHFQHDQDGATLRATEVKPKLDRFVLVKLGDGDYEKGRIEARKKGWLVDDEKGALDYKLSISDKSQPNYYLPLTLNPKSNRNPNRDKKLLEEIKNQLNITCNLIAPSPFFANSDKFKFQRNSDEVDTQNSKLADLRFALYQKDPIDIEIISTHKDLIVDIDSIKELFFFINNFGTRQSKGFGCFSVQGSSSFETIVQQHDISKFNIEAIYSKTFSTQILQNIFTDINDTWKIVKAGNSFGSYQKSDLFNYFYHQTPKVRWEKRAIKKSIKSNYGNVFDELKSQTAANRIFSEADSIDNHMYIRALLGLAENFEYGTNDNRDKVKIDVNETNNFVDRFQSPITFKIVEGKIYLICYKINPLLHMDENSITRVFSFDLKSTINRINFNGNLANLEIPGSFSVAGFLDSDKYDTATGRTRTNSKGNILSIAKSYGYERIK